MERQSNHNATVRAVNKIWRDACQPAVFNFLGDIFSPAACLICGQTGTWLCVGCLERVPLLTQMRCKRCGGRVHEENCHGNLTFQNVLSVGLYSDPMMRRLITRYKYDSLSCLDSVWREILKKYRSKFVPAWPWAGLSELIVTWVPADPIRLRQRGFDHARRLAELVRETLVPWAECQPLLRRQRTTPPNARLPDDLTRAGNVRGAFVARWSVACPVLLIDDVLTTGATLHEAAQALQTAGVDEIYALTLANGVSGNRV